MCTHVSLRNVFLVLFNTCHSNVEQPQGQGQRQLPVHCASVCIRVSMRAGVTSLTPSSARAAHLFGVVD